MCSTAGGTPGGGRGNNRSQEVSRGAAGAGARPRAPASSGGGQSRPLGLLLQAPQAPQAHARCRCCCCSCRSAPGCRRSSLLKGPPCALRRGAAAGRSRAWRVSKEHAPRSCGAAAAQSGHSLTHLGWSGTVPESAGTPCCRVKKARVRGAHEPPQRCVVGAALAAAAAAAAQPSNHPSLQPCAH